MAQQQNGNPKSKGEGISPLKVLSGIGTVITTVVGAVTTVGAVVTSLFGNKKS